MPDGKHLVFPSGRHLCIWNIMDGRKGFFIQHSSTIFSVGISALRTIVTIAGDDFIRIWDIGRKEPKRAGEKPNLPQADRIVVKYGQLKLCLPLLVML